MGKSMYFRVRCLLEGVCDVIRAFVGSGSFMKEVAIASVFDLVQLIIFEMGNTVTPWYEMRAPSGKVRWVTFPPGGGQE